MIARFALDVVDGPASPVGLMLMGMLALCLALEGGLLALMGMRPVGKAFTTAFLVNMASLGAGFIVWMILETQDLGPIAVFLGTVVAAIVVQALVLNANRLNLTRNRAWLSALVMKLASLALLFGLSRIMG